MAEYAAKQTASQSRGDLEMSDIRLLDEGDDDDLIFGQSNLTSVLANPDFGRRRCTPSPAVTHLRLPTWSTVCYVYRPWDRFLNFVRERPHPLFNTPAAGLAEQARMQQHTLAAPLTSLLLFL